LHPSWVALIGLTTTCCIEYAVDMHGPSVMCKCLHLCGFVTRYNFFFLTYRVSLLQKWKISWVTVRERRSKDRTTVDVDCNYAVVSNASEQ
jgi:hypothetical protein